MASVALDSREFLTSCLRTALDDPDLVDAISDQALEHGFSALSIGSGKVTVEQLKDQLYLTMEEAKSVMSICASMIAGHQSKEQERRDHLSLKLKATPSGRLALNIKADEVAMSATPTKRIDPLDFEPLDAIMENAAVVVISRTSANASGKKLLEIGSPLVSLTPATHAPAPSPAPAPAPTPLPTLTPVSASAPVTSPAPPSARTPSPVPVQPHAVVPSTPASALASPAPAPSPSPARSPARPLAPSPAVDPSPTLSKAPTPAKPAELLLPLEQSSPQLNSPVATSSPAATPSYLRPTAAHKARTIQDATTKPTAEHATAADAAQRRSVFSRMTSTLLAPTQAFVARVTGRNEELKSKKDGQVGKTSANLESMLRGTAGQRTTKPQPFSLRSDARGTKSCVLSTEDIQLAEARAKAFKRKPVPKHVHESRPIAPTPRTPPKEPQFEPFQLASAERHKTKLEERKQKQREEEAREEEKRKFKARAFDPSIKVSPAKPAKPAASPPTRGVAPALASDARIAHYHAVVEPAKKAREAEKDKERQEAERKAKELEEMNMEDYRKTLEFKARRMPDFSAPFQPDPNLARPVTTACEPVLHTVKRLGAAPAPNAREDKEGSGLGKGQFDGAGYVDPFFASLRKSASASSSQHGSNPGSKNPSMRRSTLLRQPAANSGSLSRAGSRASATASGDLQAAIRAAARDAARDLAAAGNNVDSEEPEQEEQAVAGTKTEQVEEHEQQEGSDSSDEAQ